MERIKLAAIILVGGNAFLWGFCHPGPPTESPEVMTEKIEAIERELPELQETAQWVERVEGCLESPPEGNPEKLIQEISTLAGEKKVTLQQTRTLAGEPPRIELTGVGPYPGIAAIANVLETRQCVQIERVTFTKHEDGQVEATFNAMVRSGQWEGQGKDKPRPEPINSNEESTTIGEVDIFNRTQQEEPAAPQQRPAIRYLGMFAGKKRTTVILDVDQTNVLVGVGDTFSQGLKVVSANDEAAQIRDAAGEEWSVPMEIPR